MASAPRTAAQDLSALEEISEAIASGSGLPEVVRASGRALGASLVLIDRSSAVLAVAAASPADERSLMAEAADVQEIELRVADQTVGRLRLRARGDAPDPAVLRLVTTLIAAELERVRAPERASAAAAQDFLEAVVDRRIPHPADLVARAKELGLDIEDGGAAIVARAHPLAPADYDLRAPLLHVSQRGARPP